MGRKLVVRPRVVKRPERGKFTEEKALQFIDFARKIIKGETAIPKPPKLRPKPETPPKKIQAIMHDLMYSTKTFQQIRAEQRAGYGTVRQIYDTLRAAGVRGSVLASILRVTETRISQLLRETKQKIRDYSLKAS